MSRNISSKYRYGRKKIIFAYPVNLVITVACDYYEVFGDSSIDWWNGDNDIIISLDVLGYVDVLSIHKEWNSSDVLALALYRIAIYLILFANLLSSVVDLFCENPGDVYVRLRPQSANQSRWSVGSWCWTKEMYSNAW